MAKKYQFKQAERHAVYIVHDEKCYMCGDMLTMQTVQIDHVIPESIAEDTIALEKAISNLGLPKNFEVNSYENWLPACGNCNREKLANVWNPSPIVQIRLKRANDRADKARELASKLTSVRRISNAISIILGADESVFDPISIEDLKKIISCASTAINIATQAKELDRADALKINAMPYESALEAKKLSLVGKQDDAREIFIGLISKSLDPRILFEAYVFFRRICDFDLAKVAMTKYLDIFIEAGDRLGEGYGYHFLGILDYITNNYEAAEESYREADEIFVAEKSNNGLLRNYTEWGALLARMNDFDKASEHYENAEGSIVNDTSPISIATLYGNIGQLNFKLNDIDAALDYFLKVRDLSKSNGVSELYGRSLNDIGRVHLAKTDYDSAEKILSEALQVTKENGDNMNEAEANRNLGLVYLHRDSNKDLAIEMTQRYVVILKKLNVHEKVIKEAEEELNFVKDFILD